MSIPAVKRANAVSVMAPRAMLILARGFGRILWLVMADRAAKKKAAEDTTPWGMV